MRDLVPTKWYYCKDPWCQGFTTRETCIYGKEHVKVWLEKENDNG